MGESVPTPEKSKCQYDDVKPGMKRSTWLTKETYTVIHPYYSNFKPPFPAARF